jgi:mevalonate kinase
MQKKTCYAHGKLLITGEYLVLEGARALAVPVNRGQFMRITPRPAGHKAILDWVALRPDGLWFSAKYEIPSLEIIETSDEAPAVRLGRILSAVRQLQPDFVNGTQSFEVETRLEFDTEYGFGSSSTLIACLSQWAGIDPILLQWKALGGSGYDVACAFASSPLFYQIADGKPVIQPVAWQPSFSDRIFFVFLGQKQRSDQSIRQFKKRASFRRKDIETVSEISAQVVKSRTLENFENLLEQHEQLLSGILGLPPVKENRFPDYDGVVKSLGAWGGDFVLVTTRKTEDDFRNEMKARGYNTVFSWNELVLNL